MGIVISDLAQCADGSSLGFPRRSTPPCSRRCLVVDVGSGRRCWDVWRAADSALRKPAVGGVVEDPLSDAAATPRLRPGCCPGNV